MTEGVFALPRRNGRTRAHRAVVLAGGRGTRLAPYTSVLPKPLMPIGEKSILELVLAQLSSCGIRNVTLCVGYLAHLIEAVLGNRSRDGVNITYVREEEALGTAAPLRMVDNLDDTFVVMNGDVLTTLDYEDLIRHHHENGNLLTIATHDRPIKIDYGVLRLGKNGSSGLVREYVEKPEMTSTVSMGIYAMEPGALEYLPDAGYFDFPDLVQALLAAKQRVGAYRFKGMWFDIGRQDDYARAVDAWLANGKNGSPEERVDPNVQGVVGQ
jgi:NDP-sugar pyrophosphorylase family protein